MAFPAPASELDELFAAYRASDAPGCVVGIAHRGVPLYRAGFGLASLEHGIANLPTTRMPIASITKHFTSAAALVLQAEGRLSLEDPVGRWLPEISAAQGQLTLRQLMTHTAGVRCYLDQAVLNGYATMSAAVAERFQKRQAEINFAPGTGTSYSNGGYLLLSWAIERAAGLPFEQVLATRLFVPNGMYATSLPRYSERLQRGFATRYSPFEDGRIWRPAISLTEELLGDGGIVSSIDDLLRWAQFLRSSSGPVSYRTLSDARERESDSSYGFGLITESWRGKTLVHHAGGLPGASSTFLMLPDEELHVVILCNRPAPAIDLSLKIVAILLKDALSAARTAPATAGHEALLGQYLCEETGMLLGFADLDGQLGLSVFGCTPFLLEGRTPSAQLLPFSADVGAGTIRFRADAPDRGLLTRLWYQDGGRWYLALRVEGPCMSPDEVVAVATESYRSESASATLSFEVDCGALYVRTWGEYGMGRYPAESIGPDLVRFWPTLFPGGMLIRLRRMHGRVHQLILSTARTRRTLFERRTRVTSDRSPFADIET